ncbi:MAG: hypothetical protein COC01_01425 [Bacteroidetes bacterium]|nr:MAG: hypothetical protein COC01_01425 [Bacteroidota bacterium]
MKITAIIKKITVSAAIILFAHFQAISDGLVVKGKVFNRSTPIKGATVKLYEDVDLIKTIETSAKGMYKFKLELNTVYYMEISYPNHIVKIIKIDTNVPVSGENRHKYDFNVKLFSLYGQEQNAAFNKPAAKINYNPRKDHFTFDKQYNRMIKKELREYKKLIYENWLAAK